MSQESPELKQAIETIRKAEKNSDKQFGYDPGDLLAAALILLDGYEKGANISNANKVHGHARRGKHTRVYRIWRMMRRRCSDAPTKSPRMIELRKDYGAKGIRVCDRWEASFLAFLEDMGEPEEGMTLDRIDNSKGYCKENCRWATRKQQTENRSVVHHISYLGETKTASQWMRDIGLSPPAIFYLMRKGMDPLSALIELHKRVLRRTAQ